VQAEQAVALVALCNIYDRPPVLGCGVGDREALDHAGCRHAQVVGAAWNRLNRGMALDRHGAAACDRCGDGRLRLQ
jgi:hypothetical protein